MKKTALGGGKEGSKGHVPGRLLLRPRSQDWHAQGTGTPCHHPRKVITKQQPPSSPRGEDSLEETLPRVGLSHYWPHDFSGTHPPLSESKTHRPQPSQAVIPLREYQYFRKAVHSTT